MGRGGDFVGPGGAFGDPGAEGVDLCGCERGAAAGHGLFVGAGEGDAAEEFAGVWLAGGDDGGVGAGGEGVGFGVEAEVGFLDVGAVALEAGALQEGEDLFGEVDGGVGGGGNEAEGGQ